MAKKDKSSSQASKIKLTQPDRSGPTEQTLLDIAQERNLFSQADKVQARNRRKAAKQDGDQSAGLADEEEEEEEEEEGDGKVEPEVEHVMDTFLWGISLGMLHFTLDVLVQHQYAMAIYWPQIVLRFGGAVIFFAFLVFVLHNHPGNKFLFGIPYNYQSRVRQAVFFAVSVVCGCYLIYVTNKEGYLRVMKQAPALGCLWVWAVIEMNLGLSVASLGINGLFMWWAGLALI